jgi:hypothetical protein
MNSAELDPEKLIPRTQRTFRLDQVAKIFTASVEHLFTLISEGELIVPKKNVRAAKSPACILVPRKNLVDFVRRRSSPAWFSKKRRDRTKSDIKEPKGGRAR